MPKNRPTSSSQDMTYEGQDDSISMPHVLDLGIGNVESIGGMYDDNMMEKKGPSCARCCDHCYFLMACCCFMLSSSSPRLCTILDFLAHFIGFVVYIKHSSSYTSFFKYIGDDFDNFNFHKSVIDVVMLAIIRTVMLFITFSYKRQIRSTPVIISYIVGLFSFSYCILKIIVAQTSSVQIFSLVSILFILVEQLLFALVRRRHIENPEMLNDMENIHMGNYHQNIRVVEDHNQAVSIHGLSPIHTDLTPMDGIGDMAGQSKSVRGRRIGLPPKKRTAVPPAIAPMREDMGVQPTSHQSRQGKLHVSRVEGIEENPQVPHQYIALAGKDSHFITFEGILIHYTLSVPDSYREFFESDQSTVLLPPALVAVHGFGSGAYTFDGLSQAVGTAAGCVLAFDKPGFGLSARLSENQVIAREKAVLASQGQRIHINQQRAVATGVLNDSTAVLANAYNELRVLATAYPDSNPYLDEFSARLLFALVHRHRLQHAGVVVMGHHSGASAVAQACVSDLYITRILGSASLTRSPIIKGLVFIAPSLLNDGFPPLVRSLFGTSLGKAMVEQLVRSEVGEVAVRRSWFDSHRIPANAFAMNRAITNLPGTTECYTYMASLPAEQPIVQHLSEITCPVLIVHGENDKIIPATASHKTARELVNAHSVQLLRLPQCGNVVHQERTGALAQAVRAFISQANRSTQ